MIIDTFDHRTGWGTAESIIPDEFDHLEKLLTNSLGFEAFEEFGEPGISGFKVYAREDAFLVWIDTPGDCRMIYCMNLPSLISLLAQLEPWFRMSRATSTIEARELERQRRTYNNSLQRR